MSLNFVYSIKEGVIGLRRTRLASAITISTIAVSLTLFGLLLVVSFHVRQFVEQFQDRIYVEVFIDTSLDETEVASLKKQFEDYSGIESVYFVSKEDALARFEEEFGKEMIEAIGENPLPSSFQIQLQKSHRTGSDLETFAQYAQSQHGVDEVIYHKRLFQLLKQYKLVILSGGLILIAMVFFSTIFLIANTLRLTIFSQKEIIHNMILVGATNSFIRRPYVIQGVLQGVIGGGIASLIVLALIKGAALRFSAVLHDASALAWIPCGIGVVFGYIGSRRGLTKFLKT
ncbi:ABC transporter permease [candidate division KSB1 bacterium]|nr:ABC transporter permease [candidate division KSB1 bacterium]